MKKSTLSLTIVAGSLIASSAMADYTGLTSVNVDNGDGTWTAQIYANFSAATDELDAVFGDAQNALQSKLRVVFTKTLLVEQQVQVLTPH